MDKIPNLPNIRADQLDMPALPKLEPVGDMAHPPRFLLLYGSLRERSFSRFLTEEAARILEHFGGKVKIFDPTELPMAVSRRAASSISRRLNDRSRSDPYSSRKRGG